MDGDALVEIGLHQDGNGGRRRRHQLLELAKTRQRLIEFGKLLLQPDPGQSRRARHVDLTIEVKHPRPVGLAPGLEYLGEKLLGVVEAAAQSTVLDAMLLALEVGHAGRHVGIQRLALGLLALEYVRGRDLGVLERHCIQRDAFEDGIQRVFTLRLAVDDRSGNARYPRRRRIAGRRRPPGEGGAHRHRRPAEQRDDLARGAAEAEGRARNLQIDPMDLLVDVGLLPFLRTGTLNSIEVSRNLPSRDLGCRCVGRIRGFHDDRLDDDAADRKFADDRRHDDYCGCRDRDRNDHLAQAVEPAGDPVK